MEQIHKISNHQNYLLNLCIRLSICEERGPSPDRLKRAILRTSSEAGKISNNLEYQDKRVISLTKRLAESRNKLFLIKMPFII